MNEVQQFEHVETVTETPVSVMDSDAFYQALERFYEAKLPMIEHAIDQRLTEIMSFFVSGYFLLVGLIVGIALWLTLKDSR